jgi:hypothetical protein
MAIMADFLPSAELLLVFSDNLEDVITISCAAGHILVNPGAVSIRGGQPTVANTAEIQIFSKGGEDKIVLDETNGVLPAIEVFEGDCDDVLRWGASNVKVVACSDPLMWNRGEGTAKTVPDAPRLLSVGTLILAIALCELVFQAGWKQTSAGKCNQSRMFDCQAVMASPKIASSPPVASALSPIPFVNARSWMSSQLERAEATSSQSGRRTEPDCAQGIKPCHVLALVRPTERAEQRRHGHKS